jgi:hypothetical protein
MNPRFNEILGGQVSVNTECPLNQNVYMTMHMVHEHIL